MSTRKKTIRKPRFIFAYLGSLLAVTIILACMGLIAFFGALNTYDTLAQIERSESEANVHASIENYLSKKEKITVSERNEIKKLLVDNYSKTSQRFKVHFNNEEIADSSQTAIMFYFDDSKDYNLEIADKKCLEYFKTPELSKYWLTDSERRNDHSDKEKILPRHYEGKSLELIVWEAYIDVENSRFIPVVCEIYDLDNDLNGYLRGPVVSIPVEKDGKIPDGYTLYRTSGNSHGFQATIKGFEGPDNDDEYNGLMYIGNSGNGVYKEYDYKYTPLEWIPFTTVYGTRIRTAVFALLAISLIFSLIPASIMYNVKKRKYEIYEYRLKTTNAMAHDLKTPLASIIAYAEILNNNIDSDNREHYLNKISETASKMNGIVNGILTFSRSENAEVPVNKSEVAVPELIRAIVDENERQISEKSLNIDFDSSKELKLNTDKELLHQALGNLINNAVRYAKDGTVVEIKCDAETIKITNEPDEPIEDITKIKEPFIKGNSSRQNGGTGLGLAIADNDLAMLGFKLSIRMEDGRFVAEVKI